MSGNTYQDQMYRDIRLIWDNENVPRHEHTYHSVVVGYLAMSEDIPMFADYLKALYDEEVAAARASSRLADQILGHQGTDLFWRLARDYWYEQRGTLPEGTP